MATRTARRGLGARAILAAFAVFAMAAVALPASADANAITQSSVDTGWAGPTKLINGGAAFDPTDPPYQKADGIVEFVAARWNKTICLGSIIVTNKLGAIVAQGDSDPLTADNGTYSEADYKGRPNKVQSLTVDPVAFPHGLTAAGEPYTATFSAGHLEADTTCTAPIAETRTFGLDRSVPNAPVITAPEPFFRGTLPTAETGSDPINWAGPLSGTVTVDFTTEDDLTWPDDDRLETSGLSRAVVTLWQLNEFCTVFSFAGNAGCADKVATYDRLNDCTGVLAEGVATDNQPICARTFADSVDITADLSPGLDYAVDVYSLDRAGDVGGDLAAQRRSPETEFVVFHYTGS